MGALQQPLTPEILVPRIGNYLVEKGDITEEALRKALERQAAVNKNSKNAAHLLGEIMIEMNLIDRRTLDTAITEQIIKLREALQQANSVLERRVLQRTAELQEALAKLSELDRLKTNFISNISHELRTPLTHISGYNDLLLNNALGTLNPDQLDALKVMERSTERLERLIEDLILFSMVESNQAPINMQALSLIDLLLNCHQRAATKANQKHIQVSLSLSPETPEVLADRDSIAWVVNQLLDNAIKFTDSGGQVNLSTTLDGSLVRIAVDDTGIGIPEDQINEIFQPFHQLDSSSTRKYGGAGLGLALAFKIIENHGTTIDVDSQVGKGSRFQFRLNKAPTE